MKIETVKAGKTIFRKGEYKDERLLLLIEGMIVNVSNMVFSLYLSRNKNQTRFYYANTKYGEQNSSWISHK